MERDRQYLFGKKMSEILEVLCNSSCNFLELAQLDKSFV